MSEVVTITFNSVDEFIEELRDYGPNVDPIVRMTQQWKPTETLPIEHVHVIATYLRAKYTPAHLQRVMLKRFIGQWWQNGPAAENDKVAARAKGIFDKIREAAKLKKLEVRAGIYE